MTITRASLMLLSYAGMAISRAEAQSIARVNLGINGAEGDQYSYFPAISADGTVVAFNSDATNLIASDLNNATDVFVYDAATALVSRVSVDSSGGESNGMSGTTSAHYLSADGTLVVFFSNGTNLVANDTNGAFDVFVHDRISGVTERMSVDSNGVEASLDCIECAISADSNFVAFATHSSNLVQNDTNGTSDIFVHDRTTGLTERVSIDSAGVEGNAASTQPALSADGRFVAFSSDATNLVVGDKNNTKDIFLHDRLLGTTERMSISTTGKGGNGGSERPSISGDGQLVAFQSIASNLVTGDTNGFRDVFLRDRTNGLTSRLSLDSQGTEANGDSAWPTVSPEGHFVSFSSKATNLVIGDGNGVEDAFYHRLSNGDTVRISVSSSGSEGNALSGGFAAPSEFGDVYAFGSVASNLVSGDTNGLADIFTYTRCSSPATWSNYGSGLAGTTGVPNITAQQMPVLGATITVDVGNSLGAPTVGLLIVGQQRGSFHTKYGADLLVTPIAILPISFSFGSSSLVGTLSGDADFCGDAIDLQALELDPGAPRGVSFTEGLELLLGS